MKQEIYFKGSKLPFEPCPSTPNCHIDFIDIREGVDKGLGLIQQTLKSMGAIKMSVINYEINAEFRVFFFIDDVKIWVEPNADGSRVWIRSSSRVGDSDLGVNKRRVNRFFGKLKQLA
jgi:uncharacterized protein (DUF1499 family)